MVSVGIKNDQKRYFSHNYKVSVSHIHPPYCTMYSVNTVQCTVYNSAS